MNLFHRVLYQFGDFYNGWTVLEKLKKLKDMEAWSRKRLNDYQAIQLKRIITHAEKNIPFYQQYWRKFGSSAVRISTLNDLAQFPVTTKRQLKNAGEKAVDQTASAKDLLQGRTSGSTGEPFVYYKSREHHSWFIAGNFLGWMWAGWHPGDRWIRIQFRGDLPLRSRIEDKLFRCLYMPVDNLDESILSSFIEPLKRFDPVLVRGYAGATYTLARYILNKEIHTIRPKTVVCTGHTLYSHYRTTIEKAFQAPVFDSYGAEGISVANQCSYGSYHILPSVHAEVLPDGIKTEYGQAGRILLTSLTNTTMPIIRYDVGDFGVMGEGFCPCGLSWPYLKKILGRDTDIATTPSGRHIFCHNFNHIFRNINGVNRFQVVQDKIDRITIFVSPDDRYNPSVDHRIIREKIQNVCGSDMNVEIEMVNEISLPPSGKHRYVISSIKAQ